MWCELSARWQCVVAQFRTEACLALSNIAAGSPAQIQTIVDGGVIPDIISVLLVRRGTSRAHILT